MGSNSAWTIVFTPTARKMLADISDRRIQEKIADRIDSLKNEPEKQGKPLTGNLSGLYSLRAVGQRYRILYRIEKTHVIVVVLAVGIRREGSRKDIYELAARLVRLGLLQ